MRMNIIENRPLYRAWILALALGALAAGCNKDAILGSGGTAALVPAVSAVTPLSGATGVLTNSIVTATFNEAVAPITGTASMTVTCEAPCLSATGTVTLDATHTIATFTLTPGTALATATMTGTSFTVTCAAPSCVSPTGTVSYSVGARTAVFKPAASLTVGDTY